MVTAAIGKEAVQKIERNCDVIALMARRREWDGPERTYLLKLKGILQELRDRAISGDRQIESRLAERGIEIVDVLLQKDALENMDHQVALQIARMENMKIEGLS